MYRPVMVEVKRPTDTMRKKIFSGSVCGFGTAGLGWAGGAGPNFDLCAGATIFSGGGSFLTGTTVVCFLCNWPSVTIQAGGLYELPRVVSWRLKVWSGPVKAKQNRAG